MRGLLGAVLLAVLVGAPAVASGDHRVLFRIHDARVTEASGLVDLGQAMVTANDSGHPPVLFVVDGRGRTVGTTVYARRVVDVEALAPAGSTRVWAGDIGDNTHRRPTVAAYRVPVGGGSQHLTAPRYRMRYPDGPHDAEALVADGKGRLYVITKTLGVGGVYATGGRLRTDRVNRLHRVARVGPLVTDAALFPDHRHVVVRGYGAATVYTFPGFRSVGSFRLPHERQGEGISVGPGGRIRVGSEGRDSAVIGVAMPAAVRAALSPGATPSPAPLPSPTPTPSSTPTRHPDVVRTKADRLSEDRPTWVALTVPVVLALGGIGIGLALRRRTL